MTTIVLLALLGADYAPWHTPARSPQMASAETHGPAAQPPAAGAVLTVPVKAVVSAWKYDGQRDGFHWYIHPDGRLAAAVLDADGKTVGHWLFTGGVRSWRPYEDMPAKTSGVAPRGLLRRQAIQTCPDGTCPLPGG